MTALLPFRLMRRLSGPSRILRRSLFPLDSSDRAECVPERRSHPGDERIDLSKFGPRAFCSRAVNSENSQGPVAVDYHSSLQEDEFHKLADATIHVLQEKLEEYGDVNQIDGFDVDYGNEVLTLKLGNLGTYVINKQTPNRQIWLSSPVSGPSRFDWDLACNAWIYRRTKANLLSLLETELAELCGESISLS